MVSAWCWVMGIKIVCFQTISCHVFYFCQKKKHDICFVLFQQKASLQTDISKLEYRHNNALGRHKELLKRNKDAQNEIANIQKKLQTWYYDIIVNLEYWIFCRFLIYLIGRFQEISICSFIHSFNSLIKSLLIHSIQFIHSFIQFCLFLVRDRKYQMKGASIVLYLKSKKFVNNFL